MIDNPASAAPTRFAEIRWTFAWNIRGSAGVPSFVAEAERVTGLPLPIAPCTSARAGARSTLWLGPRSWLLIGGADGASADFAAARSALSAAAGALFDLTAAYAGWLVSGLPTAAVLNRGCPLDLGPRAFRAGECTQSLLGHIPALFYKPDERPLFVVMVARSLAIDAWRDLRAYAESDSYTIAAATPFGRFEVE